MGHEERRRREKEINRKDIIDAAERLFFSKGYENTSMDEVAKEAEFSKRTIYVYFKSKEQIYFEIMIRSFKQLLAMVEQSFQENRPQDALEELRCIFFSFFSFSREYPAYFKAIMEYETNTSGDLTSIKDESMAECYRLGEQIFGYLAHALQRGVAEGSMYREVGNKETALFLWACAVGVFNTSEKKATYLRDYHQVDPRKFVMDSFTMIVRLISKKDAGQREEVDQHDREKEKDDE